MYFTLEEQNMRYNVENNVISMKLFGFNVEVANVAGRQWRIAIVKQKGAVLNSFNKAGCDMHFSLWCMMAYYNSTSTSPQHRTTKCRSMLHRDRLSTNLAISTLC